jgi:hypothetical protein
MANTSRKAGLIPLRRLVHGPETSNIYNIASGYNTALYHGDPVQMTGTGRNIQQCAAGGVPVGVFIGCEYVDANNRIIFSKHWPASQTSLTAVKAYVVDDPDAVFEIEADSAAAGDVGALCDWVIAAGSTLTGVSATYAAVTGATATTGKSLRILGLRELPDNAYGAYAKLEVMFAVHALRGIASAVGGV